MRMRISLNCADDETPTYVSLLYISLTWLGSYTLVTVLGRAVGRPLYLVLLFRLHVSPPCIVVPKEATMTWVHPTERGLYLIGLNTEKIMLSWRVRAGALSGITDYLDMNFK